MIGDCSDCGHSVLYHMPLVGCVKCDCDEFSRWQEQQRSDAIAAPLRAPDVDVGR